MRVRGKKGTMIIIDESDIVDATKKNVRSKTEEKKNEACLNNLEGEKSIQISLETRRRRLIAVKFIFFH